MSLNFFGISANSKVRIFLWILAIDWENCFHKKDPEEKAEILIKTINETILNHASIKTLNGRNQPAISLGLLEELKKLLITKTSSIN